MYILFILFLFPIYSLNFFFFIFIIFSHIYIPSIKIKNYLLKVVMYPTYKLMVFIVSINSTKWRINYILFYYIDRHDQSNSTRLSICCWGNYIQDIMPSSAVKPPTSDAATPGQFTEVFTINYILKLPSHLSIVLHCVLPSLAYSIAPSRIQLQSGNASFQDDNNVGKLLIISIHLLKINFHYFYKYLNKYKYFIVF